MNENIDKQKEIHNEICCHIADHIAQILENRGLLDNQQFELLKEKNKELFPKEK